MATGGDPIEICDEATEGGSQKAVLDLSKVPKDILGQTLGDRPASKKMRNSSSNTDDLDAQQTPDSSIYVTLLSTTISLPQTLRHVYREQTFPWRHAHLRDNVNAARNVILEVP